MLEMEKEGTKHVWLSFAPVPAEDIENHFPNIYKTCLEAGYDIKKEPRPLCRHSITLWAASM